MSNIDSAAPGLLETVIGSIIAAFAAGGGFIASITWTNTREIARSTEQVRGLSAQIEDIGIKLSELLKRADQLTLDNVERHADMLERIRMIEAVVGAPGYLRGWGPRHLGEDR